MPWLGSLLLEILLEIPLLLRPPMLFLGLPRACSLRCALCHLSLPPRLPIGGKARELPMPGPGAEAPALADAWLAMKEALATDQVVGPESTCFDWPGCGRIAHICSDAATQRLLDAHSTSENTRWPSRYV